MKIILQKDVAKIGHRFDIKDVSDGYALNMLIPRGLAILATSEAIKRVEIEKSKNNVQREIQNNLISKSLKEIENMSLTIKGKANEKGHLFAGLHRDDISAELAKIRINLDPTNILLEQPIKEIGDHIIKIKTDAGSANLKVHIESL